MATFVILPDATTSNDWSVTGSSAHEALADGATSSYISSGTNGADCQLTFANPSVAEGDIDSISEYRMYIKGHLHARGSGGSSVIFSDGTSDSTETLNNRAHPELIETHRVTSAPIAYSTIEGLTFRALKQDTASPTKITYAYVIVYYTEATTVTENATFFGTNF